MTVALLGAVLLGQLGVGRAMLAIWTASPLGACDNDCPCEALAQPGSADTHTGHHHDDGDCCPEDEGPDDGCPMGCDDCACCPAQLVAVLPSLGPGPRASSARRLLVSAPPKQPARGVLGRIFRPPKRCLS